MLKVIKLLQDIEKVDEPLAYKNKFVKFFIQKIPFELIIKIIMLCRFQ